MIFSDRFCLMAVHSNKHAAIDLVMQMVRLGWFGLISTSGLILGF